MQLEQTLRTLCALPAVSGFEMQAGPLWDMENVLLTPHIAGPSFGGSADVQNTIWHICMDNLERYLTGNPLKNVVNRSEGY